MNTNAAIAFARFGLGRRPDENEPADPRAWLRAQLAEPDRTEAGTDTSSVLLAKFRGLIDIEKQKAAQNLPRDRPGPPNKFAATTHRQEVDFLLSRAVTTRDGFRERLVWFWYNHFTVATRSRATKLLAGAYIREAIRPHVTGKFNDMLLAVMRHPAMLEYLNQTRSVGPDSPAGQRSHHGLNENLARECLELHTVTPAAGYTQEDVTSFAKVLTGWSIDETGNPPGFEFKPRAHQPGAQTVMGRTWPEGEAGGVALLTWLGSHPSTYHHLATKLACHFVADAPAPANVARIEQVLASTGGDLGAAASALVDLPDAWQPLTKLRTPFDYIVAILRATAADPGLEPNLAGILNNLGQPLLNAPFPIGWPDRAADWSNPEAMLQRVDFAYQLSGRIPTQDPLQIANAALGPLMQADTLATLRGAGSRRDAMMLALACPEMQRR